MRDITAPCEIVEKAELATRIGELTTDIVVTFGAGDIDRECEKVSQILQGKSWKLKVENWELRIEANAIKRGQSVLARYAEREHFRAAEGWSIENWEFSYKAYMPYKPYKP